MIKAMAYINGKFITKEENINIISPETNQSVGSMPALNKSDVDNAYQSALNAQSSWESLKKDQRISLIKKWAELLLENKKRIANIMVKEIAKPLNSSISEIERTVQYMIETIAEYEAMMSTRINIDDNKYVDIYLKPLGVILAIGPFNYPINLSMTKLCPALLTGNTVVFKSSTNGTLSCFELIKLAEEVGFPPGVINFVTGRGADIGDILITNKINNAIMFTGGTKTGLDIAKISTLKYLMFELGGNDAAIVCKDADIEKTTDKIISGAFSYSGQRCTAIKRVFVDESIENDFIKLLIKKTMNLSVGLAIDNNTITALINKQSVNNINNLLDDAIKKGARISSKIKQKNNLFWPLIVENANADMKIMSEEQFGPILPIMSFSNINEAIKLTNDSHYGLQACVFSKSIKNAQIIAKQLNVGSVNINGPSQRGPDFLPFIGVKNSGLTTQGVKYALNSVLREFNVVVNN